MARPIKETPILFGEDARRFQERMGQQRIENSNARQQRLQNYAEILTMLEKGKDYILPKRKMSIDEANRILSQ